MLIRLDRYRVEVEVNQDTVWAFWYWIQLHLKAFKPKKGHEKKAEILQDPIWDAIEFKLEEKIGQNFDCWCTARSITEFCDEKEKIIEKKKKERESRSITSALGGDSIRRRRGVAKRRNTERRRLLQNAASCVCVCVCGSNKWMSSWPSIDRSLHRSDPLDNRHARSQSQEGTVAKRK